MVAYNEMKWLILATEVTKSTSKEKAVLNILQNKQCTKTKAIEEHKLYMQDDSRKYNKIPMAKTNLALIPR